MTNHALMIGIGDLPGLAPLPAAANDTRSIAHAVSDLQRRHIRMFADNAITTLLDAEATSTAVLGALQRAAGDAPPDMALLYVASYATLSPTDDPTIVLAGDTPQTRSEIRAEELYRALTSTRPAIALAWFDLCAATPDQAGDIASALTTCARRAGVLALSACAGTCAERDRDAPPMGRLTAAVLAGLQDDSLVTLYEGALTFARLAEHVTGILAREEGNIPAIRLTPGGDRAVLHATWTAPHQQLLVSAYNNRSKPHCTFCGARYSFDNIYLCSVCGALYCIGCIHRREKIDTGGYRCDCGGIVR